MSSLSPLTPATVLLSLLSTACGGGGSDAQTSATGAATSGVTLTATASPSAAAALGEKIFNDKALSVSGKQSCATCHVTQFAFTADPNGPDEGLPVALGGPLGDAAGFRNAPSLAYATYSPDFFFDSDGGPNGGFFRDGRAATLSDQAIAPFTDVLEMANDNAAAVIAKLRTRPYVNEYVALYGSAVLDDVDIALHRVGQAIAAYESEDSELHSFSSKYDDFLVQKAQLTAQELHGLALFNNPAKGNCAACHPSTSADGITPPLFTDFS
jgi:cytochrome c peroxidase